MKRIMYFSKPVYDNFILFFIIAIKKNKIAIPRAIWEAEIEMPEKIKKRNKKKYDTLKKFVCGRLIIILIFSSQAC